MLCRRRGYCKVSDLCTFVNDDHFSALFVYHVENHMSSKKLNLFVRNKDDQVSEKLVEKAAKVTRVRRIHSRFEALLR